MATETSESCPHLPTPAAEMPAPASSACAECGASAPTRVCLACGYVGCCDSTRGHATAHAKASGHHVIRSLPLSANSFTWCYGCNAYLR